MARSAIPEAFRQRMWNADFIRQVEFSNLSREILAATVARNRLASNDEKGTNTLFKDEERGSAQILKELRGERGGSRAQNLPHEIARVFAERAAKPHASADAIHELEEVYWRRIWYGSYPQILEEPSVIRRWAVLSRESFNTLLNDHKCAWVFAFDQGKAIAEFNLLLDSDNEYPPHNLPANLAARLQTWTTGTKSADTKLKRQPFGLQVRIVRMERTHDPYRYDIHLGHVKFWQYLAIHGTLGQRDPETARLRASCYDRAVADLVQGRECLLPSNFSLAMGVISKDGYAIFRRRAQNVLFGGYWEYCVGEFMHGPKAKEPRFRAFRAGKPDLFAFCRAAIREELDCDAAQKSFKIFGFLMEYESLAPKLLVLHYSDRTRERIMAGMGAADDPSTATDCAKLEPMALAEAINSFGRKWTPTSKITLWLALRESVKDREQRRHLMEEFERCLIKTLPYEPEKKLLDQHKRKGMRSLGRQS